MRLVMMGTGLFAEPTFAAILGSQHPVVGFFTQPDRSTGAERGSTRQVGPGLKELARQQNVPIFQPESINTPESSELLRSLKPDLLVVAAYGQILSREVLEAPTQGGINVHASLLPRYRGAAPIAWAIYRGETESGVTIIRMSTGLDAGDMLAQEATPIGPEETAGELETRLAQIGARLGAQIVEQMGVGPVTGKQQDKSLATKAPKLTKELGLIDWSRNAEEIDRQIRAMQPWPTPYSYLHRSGQTPARTIIYKVRRFGQKPPGDRKPGSIRVATDAGGTLLVACGDGEMEIVELQPAGKKRMPTSSFLRGFRPQVDDWFGPEQATGN
ncbi:methionyl-tRNA formyltransferase [soil metagenome]